MLGNLLLVISIVYLGWSLSRYKKIMHPIVLFEGLTCLIIFLYSLKLRNYYDISERSFFILALTIVLFPIGFGLASKYKFVIDRRASNIENMDSSYELRKAFFVLISLITIITLLYFDYNIILKVLSGKTYLQLTVEGEESLGAEGIMIPIVMFIVYPTTYIVSPVCAIEVLKKNKNWKLYLIINILIVGLVVVDHGGRNSLIQALIAYLTVYYLIHSRGNDSKKNLSFFKDRRRNRRMILLLLVSAIVVFVDVSISRGIENLGLSAYTYLTCSIPHMEARLDYFPNHTYGFLSIYGFISPFLSLFRGIGIISSYPLIIQRVQAINSGLEITIPIGNNVWCNAFVPSAFFFYLDLGFIGVIIGLMIYSYGIGRSYNNMVNCNNSKNLAIYTFMIVGLMLSYIRFPFRSYHSAFGLIYLLIIYRKNEWIKSGD